MNQSFETSVATGLYENTYGPMSFVLYLNTDR